MIFYVIFGDFVGWDWGTPAILQQNPNKITLLDGCDFGLKKLGFGQTPPPPFLPWDKIPTFTEKNFCGLP